MPIALRLGANGLLQAFAPGEALEVDAIERRSPGDGTLTIGASLGALDSLILGSSATELLSLGDLHVQNVVFEDQGAAPSEIGEISQDGGALFGVDSVGVFPLRPAASTASAVGQVLMSLDGSTFTPVTPVIGTGGWLADETESLLIMEDV